MADPAATKRGLLPFLLGLAVAAAAARTPHWSCSARSREPWNWECPISAESEEHRQVCDKMKATVTAACTMLDQTTCQAATSYHRAECELESRRHAWQYQVDVAEGAMTSVDVSTVADSLIEIDSVPLSTAAVAAADAATSSVEAVVTNDLPCKGWCAGNANSWLQKCTWSNCKGCSQCTPTPAPTSRPTRLPDPASHTCPEGEYVTYGHCCKVGYIDEAGKAVPGEYWNEANTKCESCFNGGDNIPAPPGGYGPRGHTFFQAACSKCSGGPGALMNQWSEDADRQSKWGLNKCLDCPRHHGLMPMGPAPTGSNPHGLHQYQGSCYDSRNMIPGTCIDDTLVKRGGKIKLSMEKCLDLDDLSTMVSGHNGSVPQWRRAGLGAKTTLCSRVCQYTTPIITNLQEQKLCRSYGPGGESEGAYNATGGSCRFSETTEKETDHYTCWKFLHIWRCRAKPGAATEWSQRCLEHRSKEPCEQTQQCTWTKVADPTEEDRRTECATARYKQSVAQCSFSKTLTCSTSITANTTCSVSKEVVCNAIQKADIANSGTFSPPTAAEKEACAYVPGVCSQVAMSM